MKNHKDYAYSEFQNETQCEVVINSHLRGTTKTIDNNNTVSESPYDLLVWATSNHPEFKEFQVSAVELKGTNKETEVDLKLPDSKAYFKETKSEDRKASIVIPKLDIEHIDYELSFSYSVISEGGKACSEKLSVKFNKQLNEKKVSAWDALMGI